MDKHYTVAIDGPSGAGKSTIARAAAARFGFIYVDTGAMYRTVGLAAARAGLPLGSEERIIALLPGLDIRFGYAEDGRQRMYLNGEDVTGLIRTPEISMRASEVSAMPEVRAYLLDMQRRMAERQSVVMDGRDIGTVVLPQADLKIFLTASARRRAQRRDGGMIGVGESRRVGKHDRSGQHRFRHTKDLQYRTVQYQTKL